MTAAVSHCPLQHRLRDGRPEDLPLIIRTWIQSARVSPAVWGVPTPVYHEGQRALILRELGRSCAIIAANPDDDAHVYGYVIWRAPSIVHYVFVKDSYRRVGLATALISAAQRCLEPGGFSFTHSNLICKEARPKLDEIGAVFNPYLLYG